MKKILFLKLLLLLITVSRSLLAADVERVSFFELISSPDKYANKAISTEGILCATSEAIALYPSTESCKFGLTSMAIGLDLDKEVYIKRELFGHMKPVMLKGIVSERKNVIILDGINFNTKVKNAHIWRLPRTDYEVIKSKPNKLHVKLVSDFIDAIVDKDIKKLQSIMNLDKSDFNRGDRFDWVLFNAPLSLSKTLKSESNISYYRSKVKIDGEYLNHACIGSDSVKYNNYVEMKDASDSTESFCFQINNFDNHIYVSSSDFGIM